MSEHNRKAYNGDEDAMVNIINSIIEELYDDIEGGYKDSANDNVDFLVKLMERAALDYREQLDATIERNGEIAVLKVKLELYQTTVDKIVSSTTKEADVIRKVLSDLKKEEAKQDEQDYSEE